MDKQSIRGHLKGVVRNIPRVLVLLAIILGIAWFFFFRSSGEQANTVEPETLVSQGEKTTTPEPTKSSNNSTEGSETGKGEPTDGALPAAGPADTLAIFAVAAVAGTLFWEARSRLARANKA